MKKLFGAVIVGTMVFGAVFASASALPLVPNTGIIQSSDLVSVTCQTTPVSVTYNTLLDGQGVNDVKSVTLHDIQAECVGDQAAVQLIQPDPPYSGLGGPGNMVWYLWGTIPAPGDFTMSFGPSFPDSFNNPGYPPVAQVNHLIVMISTQ